MEYYTDVQRQSSTRVNIWFLNSSLHVGECNDVRIYLPGPLSEQVTYTVRLRTSGGLYFNAGCTSRSETWRNLRGRSWYSKDYPVYACDRGYASGTLTAELLRGSTSLYLAQDTATITPIPTAIPPTRTATPPPTTTVTPTRTATPAPTRESDESCLDVSSDTVERIRVPMAWNEYSPDFTVSLDPVIRSGDCVHIAVGVEADTFTGGGTYAARLSASNYLGFNNNCQDDYHSVADLEPGERQAFIVPVFACGHSTSHEGSIEIVMVKGTSQRKETSVSSVILLETSYDLSHLGLIQNHPSKCYNPKDIGMEHTSSRTSNGEAHYVRIKTYVGQQGWEVLRSVYAIFPSMEPGDKPSTVKPGLPVADLVGLVVTPLCAIGMVESLASGTEERSLTTTLTRTDEVSESEIPSSTKTCSSGGICTVLTEQVNFNGRNSATFRLSAVHIYDPGDGNASRPLNVSLTKTYRP